MMVLGLLSPLDLMMVLGLLSPSDNPVRNGEDDALSLFQGHDLKEESDRSFDFINEI